MRFASTRLGRARTNPRQVLPLFFHSSGSATTNNIGSCLSLSQVSRSLLSPLSLLPSLPLLALAPTPLVPPIRIPLPAPKPSSSLSSIPPRLPTLALGLLTMLTTSVSPGTSFVLVSRICPADRPRVDEERRRRAGMRVGVEVVVGKGRGGGDLEGEGGVRRGGV